MKRAFIVVLLVFYSFAASGASVHLHFCGSHLIDFSFFTKEHDDCCCEEKNDCIPGSKSSFSKPCCAEQIASLKLNDDQSTKSVTALNLDFSSLSEFPQDIPAVATYFGTHVVPVSNGPPPPKRCEVFLFVRNLRI